MEEEKIFEEIIAPQERYKYFDIEKDFEVSDVEKETLLKEIRETETDDAKIGQTYVKGIKNLEEEKFQNKMNYVSSIAGETVSSDGLNFNVLNPVDFVKNIMLKYDLSRSANFGNRKKKFLNMYPEGEYTRIKVPYNENDSEFLELFKINKDDKEWKMISPYGRDIGEIPQITGMISPEEITAELAALYQSRGASALNKFLRVLMGARIGIEAKDVNEALRGYAEREYEDGFPDAWTFTKNLFTDGQQNIEALLGAGFYSLGDTIAKTLTGKLRFGEVEGADAIVAAAERLGVEPLVFAQLAQNPILRKTFFQAGDFSGVPGSKTAGQIDSLLNKLDEIANKQDVKPIDLLLANETIEKEMAALIKNAGTDEQALMRMNDLLPVLAQKYNANVIKTNKSLTNKALSFADDASIDLSSLKKTSSSIKNSLTSGTFYTGKVDPNTGTKIKGAVNVVPQSVDSLLADINKLQDALNSGGKGNKAQFDKSFKALLNVRNKASEMLRSDDKAENYAAREILNSIDNIFNNFGGDKLAGNEQFLTTLTLLKNHLDQSDAVLNTSWARTLMTGTGDPDQWVDLVINPNNKIKLNVLKQMIESEDTPKVVSDYALKTIRKSFVTKLLNNPENLAKNLDEWITKDKDTLIYMLGDDAQSKIDKLYNVAKVNNQLSKSIFKEALVKQGEDFEIINEIIKKGKGGGIGVSKELDEMIRIGGDDFVESVRAGIIENIMTTSIKAAKEGKIGKTLDIGILQKQIEDLQNNDYLLKFFSEQDLQNFSDIGLYVSRLGEAGDVGGPMAAGSLRAKVAESIFNPFSLVDVGLTILRYDLLARILARPASVKVLRDYQDDILNSKTLDGIILSIGQLARDTQEGDTPFVAEEFLDPRELESSAQIPVQIPTTAVPGSAVSSAQVIAPLPTMSQGAPMNVARAQQAFPFDPIFAAGGGSINKQGIMNTSRGRQMVV